MSLKWIEDNFHEIKQFVAVFRMTENTPIHPNESSTMTIYDCYSYYESVAMTAIAQDTMHTLSHEDRFICKERGDKT
jgi:hypothetical protein